MQEQKRYQTIDEIPDYAKPTIERMIRKGMINGTGDGLNLSEDMLRTFVILDRASLFN